MSVPLIVRDEVIGALHFRSRKPDEYRPEDLRLAERIGEQIAGAIANAQLYADLKETENSLRESEKRFRALVDQAAVGVAEIEMETGRFPHGQPAPLRARRQDGGGDAGHHLPGDYASGRSHPA